MSKTRIQINSIVENQVPGFVREDFPLITEFLKEYYRSQEIDGSSYDLLQNIDQYVKLESITNLTESTKVQKSGETDYFVDFFDSTVYVESTQGFPEKYGLIKINDEIITYKNKTDNTFEDCVRGFSGVENLKDSNNPESLVFSTSGVSTHSTGSEVVNLSILFLKEFLNKLKKQISPGFENRKLHSEVDERLFLKRSKDFYHSKGTDNSFKILFKALYGVEVDVIKPRDFLIEPSDAQYRVTRDIVVEPVFGDPKKLLNRTLFQDTNDPLTKSYGSVTSVERITRAGKEYYILSLDYDFDKDISVSGSIFGQFKVTPKTKLTENVSINSTTLYVDSTVGFPPSGKLIVNLNNGNTLNIFYEEKTLNQFLKCTGVSEVIPAGNDIFIEKYAYSTIDRTTNETVRVKITGVLSDLEFLTNTYQFEKGDTAKIISLGTNENNIKLNNWIFNFPVTYNVESQVWLNAVSIGQPRPTIYRYEIYTFDDNQVYQGDSVELDLIVKDEFNLLRIKKTFIVESGSTPQKSFIIINDKEIEKVYSARKLITKTTGYDYSANVQNTYEDYDKNVYVSSPSLPNYSNESIDVKDRSITFSGLFGNPLTGIKTDTITFTGSRGSLRNHSFLTGDSVVYVPGSNNNTLSIPKGIYFTKKIDNNTIKLSSSRENISNNIFLSFYGDVLDNQFIPYEFVDENLNKQNLESQKLIRQIKNPENDGKLYTTNPGFIGILANGVEIVNYKSSDTIYYGPIEEIKISAKGENYDIINPPILEIVDSSGSDAEGLCEVSGSLKRIDIIDSGFDYLQEPTLAITGGNGVGAKAKANLISVDHSVSFNSEQISNQVDLQNNIIIFPSDHRFRDNEKVFYISDNQLAIGGLIDSSIYYVSVQDSKKVKLHKNLSDSVLGINTVSLTSYGKGIHSIKAYSKKKVIGSISVINPGTGYKNRKISIDHNNINLSNSTINAYNHKYENGEIITYNSTGNSIGGLVSGSKYIVTKIDQNTFKLSEINLEDPQFFYRTKQYINFTSTGSGIHSFNYPEINVEVVGAVGISTISQNNYVAKLQPIFRGQIESVYITNNGVNYGSEEIVNLHRKPQYHLKTGKDAKLQPVIINGRISQVLVLNDGSEYNSVPDISIIGTGSGAILTPIIQNGRIVEVKVINGGFNYNKNNTTLTVSSSGKDCKLDFKIKSWDINLVERLRITDQISSNDGIISNGIAQDYGLQYSHAYSPKKLREILFSKKEEEGVVTYRSDLSNDVSTEKYHSPIIGWAYDGNPIYGPYGFSNIDGGIIRQLISGYSSPQITENRPSVSIYPLGFFVQDYVYTNNGDLDEHNGRFCKTPEFPNGVYAYFSSITQNTINGQKLPEFPYLIGNTYKSKPIEFNFNKKSNQDDIDIQETNWLRNTFYYNFNSDNTNYEFIVNPNKIQQQLSDVKSSSLGKVEEIKIIKEGKNYKVNDTVVFNNTDTGGFNAYAVVSSVNGKEVEQIEYIKEEFADVEIVPTNNSREYVAYLESPHDIKNFDVIKITGLGTYFSPLEGTYVSQVGSSSLTLTQNVLESSVTGLVTYFAVSGNLNFEYIRENDIFEVGNERIKILNVDVKSSRIRVLRDSEGSSHVIGEKINEIPRKLKFKVNNDLEYNFNYNRELYFNPEESIGIGTVGIGSTYVLSNPGLGATQVFIPVKSIYIPNHQLNTNDIIKYYNNDNDPISVYNSQFEFDLNSNYNLYVAKLSNDFIGVSTNKIGIGSTGGSFVGIGTTTNLVYFTSKGSGTNHSFKTANNSVVTADIIKGTALVTTKEPHQLLFGDQIDIKCLSTAEKVIKIKYNKNNRRILVDPKNFNVTDINLQKSTIKIVNHEYKTGEKVIYTSDSPSDGLINDKIYYIVSVDTNNIKLSDSYYNSILVNPITIDILSQSVGTLAKINPEVELYYNNKIIFDLSDSSLSYSEGSEAISAFKFNLYTDPNFVNEFVSSTSTENFEVKKYGEVGTPNAKVEFAITNSVPKNLYYTLIPVSNEDNPIENVELINDKEFIVNSNKITIKNSVFTGKHIIKYVTDNTFVYPLSSIPEKFSYTDNVSYTTSSSTATGGINHVSIKSTGKNYKKLPFIEGILSDSGTGAILVPRSESIGQIKSTRIMDIGFEYSSDYSLRPRSKFPDILKVEPLSSFERIEVVFPGNGYDISPDLVVLDGSTGKLVSDVVLKYEVGNNLVKIIRNSTGFYNSTPTIIPTNNPNGVGINQISFDSDTKEVTVVLNQEFSDVEDFPFEIGDKVLVENISVVYGLGYNSSDYNYSYFTVTDIDRNIGGSGSTITYNMSEFLTGLDEPGPFNAAQSYGRIIPVKDFPIFNSILKKNQFFDGEVVFTDNETGVVEKWDSQNEYLKVETISTFKENSIIKGKVSGSQAIITSIETFPVVYKVDSNSIVEKGWKKETGFLNNSTQRIHNNDYYQYFSYSIKSPISFDVWDDPISVLNHTTGFKKFSDLIVETTDKNYSGITTEQNGGDFVGISNLDSVIDLDCYHDFDLVTENNITIGNNIISTEIIFNSKELQDFSESIGNRVLKIDNVSNQFNHLPRLTPYSIVDTFRMDSGNTKKYIVYIKDKRYTDERQIMIVTVLHDDSYFYINQYARLESYQDLGSFDVVVEGDEANLLFYPSKYEFNDYDISFVNYTLDQVNVGVGSTSIGNFVEIKSEKYEIPANASETILSLPTSCRSAKVLVEFEGENRSFEFDEFTLIHDGVDVDLLEYGQLSNSNFSSFSSSGLGTYYPRISGGNILVDYIPSQSGIAITATTLVTSINSFGTNSGQIETPNARIESSYIRIFASPTPSPNIISSYINEVYNSAYCFVVIEDITNNEYQCEELVILNDSGNSYISEYGIMMLNSMLGTFSVSIVGNSTNLLFTPNPDIEVKIRVFQNSLKLLNSSSTLPIVI